MILIFLMISIFFNDIQGRSPRLLVYGETSNAKITNVVPPNHSGLAIVSTNNFSLLVSMTPRKNPGII
jgi:hypothetical protein